MKEQRGWSYGNVTSEFVAKLKSVVSKDDQLYWAKDNEQNIQEVITSHSQDKSRHRASPPEVVVFPESAEEVAAVAKICNENNVPIVPRGAGTGLEGGCIPYFGGVVCDTSHLKKMELDSDNMLVRVGAGVLKNELNKFLANRGYLFGPDPSSNPSLGGMASTSGSGLSTLKYGTTRENIVSLLVVTPNGELVTTRSCVRKASTGYELTQLYIGAEGTLGIIVELVVRIHSIPQYQSGAIISFSNILDATKTVVQVISRHLQSLIRCELLNGLMVTATNVAYDSKLPEIPTLFLEFRANDKAQIDRELEEFDTIARMNSRIDYKVAKDDKEFDDLWEARRGCYWSALKYRDLKGDLVYINDVCVPLSTLADCIFNIEKDFVEAGFPCLICAHIADGNFHCLIPYQPEERERMKGLEEKVLYRVTGLGGSVSGEHGVGVGKMKYLVHEHGESHLDVQRSIKRALDPNNIMNPQKIFTLAKL